MPRGMFLKSEGFASDIFSPAPQAYRFKTYCEETMHAYADSGWPVPLEVFSSYGLQFQERFAPHLDYRMVSMVERNNEGFCVTLEDGEQIATRVVIVAAGITHFAYMPPALQALGAAWATHSSTHTEPSQWKGRSVAVIGSGASAQELAVLLHEAGADVALIARRRHLVTAYPVPAGGRTLWQRIKHPTTVVGPGWRSWFAVHFPGLFRYLPKNFRVLIVKKHLGPAGGWFVRDRFYGKVKHWTGCTLRAAHVQDGRVHLVFKNDEGEHLLTVEHVIAATGYYPSLDSLPFLSEALKKEIKRVGDSPELNSGYESNIPGLFFAGTTAANSFGPLMRFACGAGYVARRMSRVLARRVAVR